MEDYKFICNVFFFYAGSDKSFSFSTAGYHSGNMIVPIGSNKIHCEPPKEYEEQKGI